MMTFFEKFKFLLNNLLINPNTAIFSNQTNNLKSYFSIQIKIAARKFLDFSVHPILGVLLILAGFIAFSEYLFHQISFAAYLFAFVSLSLTSALSAQKRNDFLQLCFPEKRYKLVRTIENTLAALPFVIFLVYKQNLLVAVILLFISLIFAWSNFRTNFNFTLPTPFYKKPFEFIVGFRKTVLLLIGACFIEFIALSVNNFNLGIFALAIVFLLVLTFYTVPENEIFVWNFIVSPTKFLLSKIKIALIFSVLLSLPFVATLVTFYPEKYLIISATWLIGFMLIITIILAKYAAYPSEMNLPEGIVIALGLSFPPLLLIFAPYFYFKAIQKLKPFLP